MTKITIDRAIVEQALEALEWSWLIAFAAEAKLQRLHRSGEPTPASKAITALRAALADHIGEANEVVYQISMKDGAASSAWVDVDEAAYRSAKLYGEYKCRCLYPAPPQRKPLTDEEIHDCFQQSGKTKAETRRLITRAIEKMHGIGDA